MPSVLQYNARDCMPHEVRQYRLLVTQCCEDIGRSNPHGAVVEIRAAENALTVKIHPKAACVLFCSPRIP
jgi:hypothetical protein